MIYGVGVNNAEYRTKNCPYYQIWRGMIKRCYSIKLHTKQPTYADCSVCDEWLIFSNFRSWMEQQEWVGKELDKDILVKDNKIYSPETCTFVTHAINQLLIDNEARRGDYLIGVNYDPRRNKYQAKCKLNERTKALGRFDTEQAASEVYQKFKKQVIYDAAIQQTDIRLREALLRRIQ